MTTMWDHYRYTDPIAETLSAAFGNKWELMNTGGGCICLEAEFEGGIYGLVGCAVDGPLLRESERADFAHGGGYGVGFYESDSGYPVAYAADHLATTGEDVVALAQRALALIRRHTDEEYVGWTRNLEGVESETTWQR